VAATKDDNGTTACRVALVRAERLEDRSSGNLRSTLYKVERDFAGSIRHLRLSAEVPLPSMCECLDDILAEFLVGVMEWKEPESRRLGGFRKACWYLHVMDDGHLFSCYSRPKQGCYVRAMLLRHVHLPGLTRYTHAGELQDKIVRKFLAYKAASNPLKAGPDPTIITAQFHPVYTCGRREVGNVTSEQRDYLTQQTSWGRAEFHEALRGGQTTFHGPGQLVAYPILDLKRHGLSARCYVHALETAVIRTCGHYDIPAQRTENPGVWINADQKICALGVHLRRNVSSHGIGLNVSTDLGWFERIVACGLEGKGTTSLAQQGLDHLDVEDVGRTFVSMMGEGLEGVEAVVTMDEDEVV